MHGYLLFCYFTVIIQVYSLVLFFAFIIALPFLRAVTLPFFETVAIFFLLIDHFTLPVWLFNSNLYVSPTPNSSVSLFSCIRLLESS